MTKVQIHFFCVKRYAKNDFLKDVESTVSNMFSKFHYENTPIQIYRKFHLQKNWKFSDKKTPKTLIFFIKS